MLLYIPYVPGQASRDITIRREKHILMSFKNQFINNIVITNSNQKNNIFIYNLIKKLFDHCHGDFRCEGGKMIWTYSNCSSFDCRVYVQFVLLC